MGDHADDLTEQGIFDLEDGDFESPSWETKKDGYILFKDMTLPHIVNSINLLRRKNMETTEDYQHLVNELTVRKFTYL